MGAADVFERFYPEARFGGFSRHDVSIEFYSRIAALIRPEFRVLDFGAGRGAQIADDPSAFRRGLKTLRGRVAHVDGCDVDPAVLENPFLDAAKTFEPDGPLPYADASFDLIYSSWVFEHIAEPDRMAAELLRVLKPGGFICAMTPNRHGYIALASRLAGNRSHVALLEKIQPDRKPEDVFQAFYRLNTPAAVARSFRGAEVVAYARSSDPGYYFGNALLFRAFQVIHKLTPPALHSTLLIFIRKPAR